jgi:hypothetical protein
MMALTSGFGKRQSSCGTATALIEDIWVRENPWLQLQQRHRVLASN